MLLSLSDMGLDFGHMYDLQFNKHDKHLYRTSLCLSQSRPRELVLKLSSLILKAAAPEPGLQISTLQVYHLR